MNFAQSFAYLNSFVNLERLAAKPAASAAAGDLPVWNMERVRHLLDVFGRPDKNFFPVLIAGTKGKGSTGFFLESILRESGISAGFYSSPHLETPLERIRINGRLISPSLWAEGLTEIRSALKRSPLPRKMGNLTYFEVMTFLAVLAFAKTRLKVGIFEAGMGGRLDATNVLHAPLCIITNLGMDHEAFLGNTLAKIAREKAGIIKDKVHVVAAASPPEGLGVIRKTCREKEAVFRLSKPVTGMKLGLRGEFQKTNAGNASAAAEVLRDTFGFAIPNQAVVKGLKNHGWPGRLEVLKGSPSIVLDAAHNPDAVRALTASLPKEFPGKKAVVVFAVSRDKNSSEMLKILAAYSGSIILTRAASPRSQDLRVLLEQAHGLFKTVYPVPEPAEAFDLALKIAEKKSLIVITGSFFLLGDAGAYLRAHKMIKKKAR